MDVLTLLLTRTAGDGYLGTVVIGGAPGSQAFHDEIEGDGYAKKTTTATRGPKR